MATYETVIWDAEADPEQLDEKVESLAELAELNGNLLQTQVLAGYIHGLEPADQGYIINQLGELGVELETEPVADLPAQELDEEADETTLEPRLESGSLDGLNLYLRAIGKVALLTAEQEKELARQIQDGNHKAKQHMVDANLRLVVSIAKAHQGHGLELLDMIQDGYPGLVRAAEKFDPDSGYKFSTYATWWIKRDIRNGLADTSRTIRIKRGAVGKLFKINKIERELTGQLGREPTKAELAAAAQMDEEDLAELLMISSPPVSLEDMIGDTDELFVGEGVTDPNSPRPETLAELAERQETLDAILSCLSDRQRLFLNLKYGLDGDDPLTLVAIGKAHGITAERVNQIVNKALEILSELPEAQALRTVLDD